MATIPSFEHEIQYHQQGIKFIAGIDEVGMGALAGPVCAAAVIPPPENIITNINKAPIIRDSKLLSAKQREEAATWVKKNAVAWAVGKANVKEINTLNIKKASHLAMRRAIDVLAVKPDLLLVDGTPSQPHSKIPAVNIIKGDQICWSIAAASIIAKVHRDNIMIKLDKNFPTYKWSSNKGYASQAHKQALSDNGITKHHRASYAPIANLIATQNDQ